MKVCGTLQFEKSSLRKQLIQIPHLVKAGKHRFWIIFRTLSRLQWEVRELLPELQDGCPTLKYLVFRGLGLLRKVGRVCACGCMAPIKTWRQERAQRPVSSGRRGLRMWTH